MPNFTSVFFLLSDYNWLLSSYQWLLSRYFWLPNCYYWLLLDTCRYLWLWFLVLVTTVNLSIKFFNLISLDNLISLSTKLKIVLTPRDNTKVVRYIKQMFYSHLLNNLCINVSVIALESVIFSQVKGTQNQGYWMPFDC